MSAATVTRREVIAAIGAMLSSGVSFAQGLPTDEQQEKRVADYWWLKFQTGQFERRNQLYVPISDPRFNEAMQTIARPLISVSTRGGLDWRIGTADADEPNAFTWGGGTICMVRGLIRLCESEVELASVIAHEVGHVQYRHAIERFMAMRLFESIDFGIFDMSREDLVTAIRERRLEAVAPEVIFQSYQRNKEHEADAFAVRALAAAGYDLRGAATLFEKFLAMEPKDAPLESCLMSTHPETRERVARIKGLSRRYGKQRARPNSAAFDYLKRNA